jgi:hypothetical protein
MKRNGAVVLAVMLLALLPELGYACPVCFGDPNSAMTKGTGNGVLFLLGIVGFVQLGFVALFWSFWKRAKQMRKLREQFRVIEGGLGH